MRNIATLTINPSLDISATVDHVVEDSKLRCSPPLYKPGGGGINVSRAIRNLGGASLAVYPAGGPNGSRLVALVAQEGIDHHPVAIEEQTRENISIFEQSGGRQYRFVMPGPILRETEWRMCLDALFSLRPLPDFIVASGSLAPGVPDDFYARVVRNPAGREFAPWWTPRGRRSALRRREKGLFF